MTEQTPLDLPMAVRQIAAYAAAAAQAAREAAGAQSLALVWVERARLVARWTEIRALISSTDDNGDCDLAARARGVAARLRAAPESPEHDGGSGRLTSFLRRLSWPSGGGPSAPPAEAETAELLDAMAVRLSSAPSRSALAVLVDQWSDAKAVPASLFALQDDLAKDDAKTKGILDELSQEAWPWHRIELFTAPAKPATDTARAAVGTVFMLSASLARRAANPRAWKTLEQFAGSWLSKHGLRAEIVAPGDETRKATAGLVAEAPFALEERPSERALFRLGTDELRPVASWVRWIELPDRDLPENTPLLGWLHEVRRLVDAEGPDAPSPSDTNARTRFREWLETESGQSWFDSLLREAQAGPGAGRAWWDALRRDDWCRAYPDVVPGASRPVWPPDVSQAWPAVTRAVSSKVAQGLILEVGRYASEPLHARVRISDGWPEPESALARFHELAKALDDDTSAWADGRYDRAHAFSLETPGGPNQPADLINAMLDSLPETTVALAIVAFARWASAFGLTLKTYDQLEVGASATLRVEYVESKLERGLVAGGKGFALVSGDQVFRSAEVHISIGEVPPGLVALETVGTRLPPDDRVREGIEGLRKAIAGEFLGEAAVELYVEFWRDPDHVTDKALTAELSERLIAFLGAALGFEPFYPKSLNEFPNGWMHFPPGGRSFAGTVRRVHRPGLRDRDGNLRVPALVELD